MTRVFLIAGVAALAITAPAAAKPGDHGNRGDRTTAVERGAQRAQAQRAERAPRVERQQQRAMRVERPQRQVQMRAERQAPRMQTRVAERQQMRENRAQAQQRVAERQQVRANRVQAQQRVAERQQMRANRVQAQNRMAERQQIRANRMQAQNRMAERQQVRANRMQAENRLAERQVRMQRFEQIQNRAAARQQLRGERIADRANLNTRVASGFGIGGCPPGLISKNCMPPGQALQQVRQMAMRDRVAALQSFGPTRFETFDFAPRTRFLAPLAANAFLGMPLATASNFATFSPIPQQIAYLYPSTPNYYYQYGDGYVYQVDRSSSLISALIPLLAGGFMPGSYLPSSYMNSYVPNYYGLNSFYPSSYGAFGAGYGGYGGYGYNNLCNRYEYGVVYQVDCYTGLVQNVIPLYAGGYGVGQLLPSSYSYYNVPDQYRSMYYDTPDYGYWYAPGAIYQYDRGTSLITSVAALMSPGFTIGQQLPLGYNMYNVPMAYRSTYYDTPNAWYRYNNGYIYQVDPTTQLVTAIVASLLT